MPPGGIATAISVVCFSFISPAFRKICLPYVPATRQQIKNVIRALNGRSGSLIDLGSGDGRIVSMIIASYHVSYRITSKEYGYFSFRKQNRHKYHFIVCYLLNVKENRMTFMSIIFLLEDFGYFSRDTDNSECFPARDTRSVFYSYTN